MRLIVFGLLMLLLGRGWGVARARRGANESQRGAFLEMVWRWLLAPMRFRIWEVERSAKPGSNETVAMDPGTGPKTKTPSFQCP